jgi:PAS domain S-box-containing protein
MPAIFGSVRRERQHSEQLRRQAETMEMLLSASADGAAMVDRDGRLVYVSRATEVLLGQPAERLLGGGWSDTSLDPAAAAALDDGCGRVLASGRQDWVEFRCAGRWIECHLSPVRDAAGRPEGVVAIGRDITGRKTMEDSLKASVDENRALLVELHHRVRNNLHIVFSMLQMQGWRTGDDRLRHHFEEAGGRILALAKVHEMAWQQGSVAAVDFARYCQSLSDDLLRMHGVGDDWMKVTVDAQPLPMEMDRAVPLGLVVHELMTNAIQHAFSVNGDGTLSIGLRAEGGRAELTVADDGCGCDGDAVDGLGIRMVRALVQQLRGTVAIDGRNGTTVVVRFPV